MAPPGNADTQFQKLTSYQGNDAVNLTNGVGGVVAPTLIGQFDPDKLPGFNPLSAVPLETYYPPLVTGADAASRKVLKNQPLGPTMNLGGYVAQPPLLLTTLTAMEQMLSQSCYIEASKEVPLLHTLPRHRCRRAYQCHSRSRREDPRLLSGGSRPHPRCRDGDQERHRPPG